MPELPEVETVVRELRPRILDIPLISAELLRPDLLKASPVGAESFADFFRGRRFISLERRGKFLIFTLDDGRRLLAHLGMTGAFAVACEGDSQPAHLCSVYHFTGGLRLDHVDARRLGRLALYPPGADIPVLRLLGAEPLDPGFGPDTLLALVRSRGGAARRVRAIHPLLLDQSLIAGVGNIYASEALFRAGIRPQRRASRVGPASLRRLAPAIQEVLREAIRASGTTFDDYRRVDGRPGEFALQLNVYGREGQPCRVCGTPVKRIVLGGRSAFYCPRCQK
ncbi:MAG: bifunctional DNA-formamidopyrimidine glycosylase/DNA-(apurinic or apyrimidinic site) lyase [Candidatus Zixiibacteriota bacterium]|nr:MAG: bifunctional DNA-formamidopyrimidine glycosylase/DNA-(apurinic or apyrimidinic site) lyase [candidate division Zixibacteria bacterium]